MVSSDPVADQTGSRTTIFLSYARADRARAEKLARALGQAGFEVWWDALIEGGAQFARSIRVALDRADAVVVLWSRESVDSDWVRDEAALGRDRKRLVPLSLDGSEQPLGFRQYQAINVSRWRGRGDAPEIAAITRAITAAIDQTGAVAPPSVAPVSRRRMLQIVSGAAVLAIGGGGVLAWRSGLFGEAAAPADSIVVLPFRNLSGDPTQAYLSDGLTEQVRAALARNDALKVMAATSSNAAQEGGADAVAIARRIGVAFLLDGSVQRAGGMLRVSANLTDGKTGFSRWSNSIDRPMRDVFAMQTEIATMVTNALSIQMATLAPAPGGTRNVAAYEAYLRGRALFDAARDEASDRAALVQFDLAIGADPKFALAHAARSRSLAGIAGEYAKADELRTLYDGAVASAQRAVALAPELAEGHLALGYALFTGRLDLAGARGSYDKAYALGHGNADIALLYALYGARAGRPSEARAAILHALALDPLNPRTFRAAGSIGYSARRYAEAIPQLNRSLALNPKISNAHSLIGNCLYQLGRLDDARAAYLAEPHKIFRLTGLAIVEHRRGDAVAAKQALAQIVADQGDAALYQQAEVLTQWNEADAALQALRRAREVGDSGLVYLTTDPMLDPLRADPRFTAFLRELRLA